MRLANQKPIEEHIHCYSVKMSSQTLFIFLNKSYIKEIATNSFIDSLLPLRVIKLPTYICVLLRKQANLKQVSWCSLDCNRLELRAFDLRV